MKGSARSALRGTLRSVEEGAVRREGAAPVEASNAMLVVE